ncbi:MAG: SUF system NifU family Fe-S cluster assembly protein [Cellulomonas sp.]|uniref:Iron-sulfur cluster assembly scaffold protein NifU n=1 Tax=Cellulomonas gelida TaxID=1712 RepID=A0A4Y3KI07_9CELL|nr:MULTISPECIES: SUF system NifU family Fe-S cluster assembly protein [Cellulomonas]KMM45861.1 nitrogen fixation protein NifU [Cellulomonas sp. A375-1]MCR6647206.1 SUF system NifU family Fe-S cluster assembly protein [Cellulomonas sp.]MCR6703221.1 SUF system NifU family Fe-S cluster assembly protein [Cellulomonas sp.]GEA83014.1 iron-sulfur cluster assembly scaffold protein NifU [Cellulomonas gelida]GGL35847.1 iron-sulfur cluster assembly scaffold protein NifU [Cellulomonas gelida]
MSSSMEQLYQQVILDHAKYPHGRGLGDAVTGAHTAQSHQVNPTCGDEVTLQVDVDDAGVVRGVRWDGQGCSISQASVSVLHDLVVDQPLTTVDRLAGSFRDLMQSKGQGLDDEDAEEALGDAAAFTGVGKFSARVKCALLGWVALNDALIKTGATRTEREDA